MKRVGTQLRMRCWPSRCDHSVGNNRTLGALRAWCPRPVYTLSSNIVSRIPAYVFGRILHGLFLLYFFIFLFFFGFKIDFSRSIDEICRYWGFRRSPGRVPYVNTFPKLGPCWAKKTSLELEQIGLWKRSSTKKFYSCIYWRSPNQSYSV